MPMKVCDDDRRRQPLLRQVRQRIGEDSELGLLRWGRYPPVPLLGPLPEHPVGERRELAAEVAQVELPSAPPGVVCCHLVGDVQILPAGMQVERQASCAREPLRLIPHVLDEELAAEEVDP